jgi:hypothetical protein
MCTPKVPTRGVGIPTHAVCLSCSQQPPRQKDSNFCTACMAGVCLCCCAEGAWLCCYVLLCAYEIGLHLSAEICACLF